ncbi:MAG: DNA gyrase subunit A [Gammaproteobacteria bacterium]|jgi:DNA gyrase subunit A|nr:DNA gyrase subunit A [Gammaproteobacteria bacterium]MBT4461880.1 DNA gyrase subunit A [Gammaproteobacteria bacterium]MBT4654269.1 DNA gyrase subunit A [Gammaproteobacteria bacterium]MBT5116295.1 DNA gyrase subunit A [Gammaproteobacteria bacterium]MBT5761174.1 DNA gyrase subunit A [Gammaproteobacteria bacterium]
MPENQEIRFEQEMRQSYLDYAMSVIVGRALPDVRDGLKPVHRRVLFSMHELNNGWNKSYKKSARIVGDVIGKYHPHGDSAVYDTIVRLAQPFSMRHPLIDGQGNFGSVDGDSPAAMRYTEVRMSKLSQELLQDIDKNTVDFSPNYDGSEKEPTVLPTRIPNLLVNGSTGIAVGMATNIPPHNLTEVVDATIAIINNPLLSDKNNIDELIKVSGLQGPDFPTYGEIKDDGGIRNALLNGRGSFKIRAKHVIEKKDNDRTSIVFTELPYQVNKARLIENIAQLVRDKKINEISHLRDESDRDGMRLVIELKRGEQHEVLLGALYKHTNAQTSYSVNMVCLVDGEPKTLGFTEILNEFIKHRREVITKRTLHDLDKAKNKAHILEGLGVALINVDEIIALIKKSKNSSEAKTALISKKWEPGQLTKYLGIVDKQTNVFIKSDSQYGLHGKLYKLSPVQAQAILDLRLQKLTGLEQEKIFTDYELTINEIKAYIKILTNIEELDSVMKNELEDVKKEYGESRRSIVSNDEGELRKEDLIKKEDIIVVLTKADYVKRLPAADFKSQKRGGRGINATKFKDGDEAKLLCQAHTHDIILCFSTLGKVYAIRAFDIPDPSRQARGRPINNVLPLESNESISTFVVVNSFDEDAYLFMSTKNGMINKIPINLFKKIRTTGLKAILLKPGDILLGAHYTDKDDLIMLVADNGKAIKFSESDVRERFRGTLGVKGINLSKNSKLVSIIKPCGGEIITVTENGYGNRVSIENYNTQKRGGVGVIGIKTSTRNGKVVGAVNVGPDDQIIMITNKGKTIKISINDMPIIGRNTQGVRLQVLQDGEKLVAISTETIVSDE